MFIIAIQYGAYGFIGIWLALKVAAQWKRWSDTHPKGRIAYNIFIIGSGLSVIFAIVGAKLIDWLKEYSKISIIPAKDAVMSKIVIIPLIVILLSLLLLLFIKIYIKKEQKKR